MERKLASIQKISTLSPIPGADNIECATIMGWTVVVKKGEFKVNDQCVFFEIDSVLPEKEWAEFLRSKKFRVKTCKIRGQLSQGLALPIDILPNPIMGPHGPIIYQEGDDVTEDLNVTKFNPDHMKISMGCAAGNFPSFIPKTGEDRIQSHLSYLKQLENQPFYITIKFDGTSSTFAKLDNEFYVCSHNVRKRDDDKNLYWHIARKYNLQEILPDGIAIQGEICGPGIQKNLLHLHELSLFVFNVFDIKSGKFFDYPNDVIFLNKLGLPRVDGLMTGSHFNFTLQDLLEIAKGFYPTTTNHREGIVVRSTNQSSANRISFKVINNDYLLKE